MSPSSSLGRGLRRSRIGCGPPPGESRSCVRWSSHAPRPRCNAEPKSSQGWVSTSGRRSIASASTSRHRVRWLRRVALLRCRSTVEVVSAGSSVLGWERYVNDDWEIHEVPGSHDSMLGEPHVHVLAATLASCLREAQRRNVTVRGSARRAHGFGPRGRARRRRRPGRGGRQHERAGADDGVVADGHAVDHVGAEAHRGGASDAHGAAGGGARTEAGVVAEHAVVVDRRADAEQHTPTDLGAVAHHAPGEEDRSGADGRVVADHRRRVHDRRGLQVRRRGRARVRAPHRASRCRRWRRRSGRPRPPPRAPRGRRRSRGPGLPATSSSRGSARSSTPTAVWNPRARMASSTCRPWSDPPITITRLTTAPSRHRLPRNGSMVAWPGALTP